MQGFSSPRSVCFQASSSSSRGLGLIGLRACRPRRLNIAGASSSTVLWDVGRSEAVFLAPFFRGTLWPEGHSTAAGRFMAAESYGTEPAVSICSLQGLFSSRADLARSSPHCVCKSRKVTYVEWASADGGHLSLALRAVKPKLDTDFE